MAGTKTQTWQPSVVKAAKGRRTKDEVQRTKESTLCAYNVRQHTDTHTHDHLEYSVGQVAGNC